MVWLVGLRALRPNGVERGALALRGARLGEWLSDRDRPAGGLDLDGALVLPGLVNAHDHLHLNVFPRTAPGRPYADSADWVADMAEIIEQPQWRVLRQVPRAARVQHGLLKSALAGVTTVVHHDPWPADLTRRSQPITVVERVGWAHSPALAGRYGPGLAESHAATLPGRPWFVHLAEGSGERARAELGELASAGLLDGCTRLVHGVGMGAVDRERALSAGAGLVWCPASNDFLLGDHADPRPFARAGLAALGTDSRLTGARDLLDELAVAAERRLVAPAALVDLVTDAGARLVGRPRAGRLLPGAPADLVVLADDGREPAEQLVGARRADLRLVMAKGRPLVADPDLAPLFERLDEPALSLRLDGRRKLVARRLVEPVWAAGLAEPGLDRPARERAGEVHGDVLVAAPLG